MACIIGVSIVFLLEKRFKLSCKTLLILACCGYIMSLLSAGYSGFFDSLLDEQMQFYHKAFSWCFCPANSFIISLLYIMFGKILAENEWESWWISKPKSKTVLLYIVFALIGFAEIYLMKWSMTVNDAWLFLPPLTLLGFILLLQTEAKIKPELARWMRNISILVYILHPILQYANMRLFGIGNGMLMFFLTVTECIVASSMIIMLSHKIPLLKKLY
jgi:hypothetical protein